MNSELKSCLGKVHEIFKRLEKENSLLSMEIVKLKAQIRVLNTKMVQLQGENEELKMKNMFGSNTLDLLEVTFNEEVSFDEEDMAHGQDLGLDYPKLDESCTDEEGELSPPLVK